MQNKVDVGYFPDMLLFAPDGEKVLVANTGRPNEAYDIDPPGSVTIIDISNGVDSAKVTDLTFEAYNNKKISLLNKGVRIYGPGATVAQDMEPEYIALSPDAKLAYVVCQENNALAVIDIKEAKTLDILPLGVKDHNKGTPNLKQYALNKIIKDWPNLASEAIDKNAEAIKLGGFSGLYFEPKESDDTLYVFYSVPDRAPIIASIARDSLKKAHRKAPNLDPKAKIVQPLDYQSRIVRFTLNNKTGEISLGESLKLNRRSSSSGKIMPVSGLGGSAGQEEVLLGPVSRGKKADYALGEKNYAFVTPDPYGADFEGIVRDRDGHFWLCDEYRPSVYKFGKDGMLIARYAPGKAKPSPDPSTEQDAYNQPTLPEVYNQIQANRGFTAIAYDSTAHLIYTFVQSPLENSLNEKQEPSDVIRILSLDPDNGQAVGEYVYLLECNRDPGYALSRTDKIGDAVCIGKGRFMVVEEDYSGLGQEEGHKYIFEINLKGATNILEMKVAHKVETDSANQKTIEMMTADELAAAGIKPVHKTKKLNLPSVGYLPGDKIEGLSAIPNGAIALLNDNDFGAIKNGKAENSVLGLISFGCNYGLDASNEDDSIHIRNWPLLGMFQPDAIKTFEVDGKMYLASVNEGDARDFEAFTEEYRMKKLDLDADVFPDAKDLQDEQNLGRLRLSSAFGDLDGDGAFEQLYSYGARSFSIWDRFGNLIYDSGDDFEQITAELFPDNFNSNNDKNKSKDSRSDDKGPEPEALEIAELGGVLYAFIGLERMGGIMIYDISKPHKPIFIDYLNNRNFSVKIDSPEAGDSGVEDIDFIRADQSPNGKPLLIAANEISATVSIFTFNEIAEIEDVAQLEKQWRVFLHRGQAILFTNRKADYQVFDLKERLVKTVRNTRQIDVGDLPEGTYLLKDMNLPIARQFEKR